MIVFVVALNEGVPHGYDHTMGAVLVFKFRLSGGDKAKSKSDLT